MFVTDLRPGEKSILEDDNTADLIFKDLSGNIRAKVSASEPWTHEILIGLDLEAILGPNYTEEGFDAFIGDNWIGSTEV